MSGSLDASTLKVYTGVEKHTSSTLHQVGATEILQSSGLVASIGGVCVFVADSQVVMRGVLSLWPARHEWGFKSCGQLVMSGGLSLVAN